MEVVTVEAQCRAEVTGAVVQRGRQSGADERRQRSRSRSLRRGKPSSHGLGTGHDLRRSGAMVWCRICGAYREMRFKALKVACSGRASSAMRAGQLGRLLKGFHPVRKGEALPKPMPFLGFSAV